MTGPVWRGKGATSATVALPLAREAVKATRFAGGFAGLDRLARQWLLPTMFFWRAVAAFRVAPLTKKTWRPHATPPRRSHPEETAASA
jgi:hypothetical protein